MNVKLIIKKGQAKGREIALRHKQNVVGRHKDCNVRIPSEDVSRRHCVLTMQHGTLVVEDLKSLNGTFINDKQVKGKQSIYPGDILGIGPLKFFVEYEMEAV